MKDVDKWLYEGITKILGLLLRRMGVGVIRFVSIVVFPFFLRIKIINSLILIDNYLKEGMNI